MSPSAELFRHIKANLAFRKLASRPTGIHETHLLNLYLETAEGDEMLGQYVASDRGPFFRLLARSPESAAPDGDR
jgi:hypothetical protein